MSDVIPWVADPTLDEWTRRQEERQAELCADAIGRAHENTPVYEPDKRRACSVCGRPHEPVRDHFGPCPACRKYHVIRGVR